ncbi:MAG TPA: AI-2E family transporter [Flavitalea sp.]|nr:AI-2E family transporter [Flavitalea sp.]
MNTIPNNIIRQILLLLFILLLGWILFDELKFFLPAFLGAYTLYVMMRKYMFILTGRRKWKKGLAATVLMLISFVVILLPIFLLINMMTAKIGFAISHSEEVMKSIQQFVTKYENRFGIDIITEENTQKVTGWVAATLPKILNATLNTLLSVVIMYFILFFMLTQGRKMEATLYESVPLKDENITMLRKDLNGMVLSNAIGIPLIALAQGIVGVIGYILIGVEQPWFWFVITCIAAMLPVVGAAVAYVPIGILFFAQGDVTRGVILLLFGFLIIGTTDNIFRFWLQKKLGDVHPLITAFGVIIGINLFGFIGLIFGPILISLFLLMVKVYVNEFSIHKRNLNKGVDDVVGIENKQQ